MNEQIMTFDRAQAIQLMLAGFVMGIDGVDGLEIWYDELNDRPFRKRDKALGVCFSEPANLMHRNNYIILREKVER